MTEPPPFRETLRSWSKLGWISFGCIFFLQIPFPVILFASGAVGHFGGRYIPAWFTTPKKGPAGDMS